jgi:hypothetical protein
MEHDNQCEAVVPVLGQELGLVRTCTGLGEVRHS